MLAMNLKQNHFNLGIISTCLLGMIVICMTVWAEDLGYSIQADTISYDSNSSSTIFEGNVVIERQDFTLYANRVVYTESDDTGRVIMADGDPLKINIKENDERPAIEATALKAVVEVDEEDVRLAGGVYMSDGKREIRATRAIYSLKTGTLSTVSGHVKDNQ